MCESYRLYRFHRLNMVQKRFKNVTCNVLSSDQHTFWCNDLSTYLRYDTNLPMSKHQSQWTLYIISCNKSLLVQYTVIRETFFPSRLSRMELLHHPVKLGSKKLITNNWRSKLTNSREAGMALKIRRHLEPFSANQCGTRIVIRASLTAIRNEVENESDSLIRKD